MTERLNWTGGWVVVSSVLSWLFEISWTTAQQAFLSISRSLLKVMSIESVMPSNHLILCRPFHILPSIFTSIRVFSNESRVGVPKNWYFGTVVLEKTLGGPLDCNGIKPVTPKGNQLWIFIGRTDAEAPICWPPDAKSRFIKKDPNGLCINLEGWDWQGDGRGYMYTYGWFMLRFNRKQQNSVKQLSFN